MRLYKDCENYISLLKILYSIKWNNVHFTYVYTYIYFLIRLWGNS